METQTSGRRPKPSSAPNPKPPPVPFTTAKLTIMTKQQPYPLRKGLPDSNLVPTLKKRFSTTSTSSIHSNASAKGAGLDNNCQLPLPALESNSDEKVCNPTVPLKPSVSANEVLDYEAARYLEEYLINSMLEEDEQTASDILADEDVVDGIGKFFEVRAVGMLLAKNEILHNKIRDIEMFDSLLTSLYKIDGLLTPIQNTTLSSIISKVYESVDSLPITKCIFNNDKPDIWMKLATVARQLNNVLESEDKPFYFINLLESNSKEIKKQIENLEMSTKQKKLIQQSITFLVSLRLSHQLKRLNEHGMRNESYEPPGEEFAKAIGLDSLVYPDDSISSTKSS